MGEVAARAKREAGERIIDFSIGDPREPTPTFIVDALRTSVPPISQYPTAAGRRELREAIAGYVQRRHGVAVDPETQIIPTSGSKEAIFSTPLAFIDRDRNDLVTWATPGYPIYESQIDYYGGRALPYRYHETETGFAIDLDQPQPHRRRPVERVVQPDRGGRDDVLGDRCELR